MQQQQQQQQRDRRLLLFGSRPTPAEEGLLWTSGEARWTRILHVFFTNVFRDNYSFLSFFFVLQMRAKVFINIIIDACATRRAERKLYIDQLLRLLAV